jgi:thioredoxin-related protein
MKIRLMIAFMLIVGVVKAQHATGIKFEQGLSWAQVQEKAKKENKHIFLDVFTTWCGPCKQMERDIFPQAQVGDFFNANFINVRVQVDATKNDSEDVKNWHEDAKAIAAAYNINSYPTFLYFDPKGELVHRVDGASATGEDFIARSEGALNGYQLQKWQFQKGERDTAFLLKVIKSAQLMNDRPQLKSAANAYLATQQDLLTEENLKFIGLATSKTTDPGFAVLRNNAARADQVLGEGTSKRIVRTVIFDEIVLPHLRTSTDKKDHGMMVSYSGEVKKNVDWAKVEKQLKANYPDLTEEVLMHGKLTYYSWTNNLPEYVAVVSSNSKKMSGEELSKHANMVFLSSDDPASLQKALGWTSSLLAGEQKQNPQYLYFHANLLYKTGKKEEGIKTMEESIRIAGGDGGHLAETLEKMKSGKKTW